MPRTYVTVGMPAAEEEDSVTAAVQVAIALVVPDSGTF